MRFVTACLPQAGTQGSELIIMWAHHDHYGQHRINIFGSFGSLLYAPGTCCVFLCVSLQVRLAVGAVSCAQAGQRKESRTDHDLLVEHLYSSRYILTDRCGELCRTCTQIQPSRRALDHAKLCLPIACLQYLEMHKKNYQAQDSLEELHTSPENWLRQKSNHLPEMSNPVAPSIYTK